MLIFYRHFSAPFVGKRHDTKISYENFKKTGFYNGQTQKEWDELQLKLLKRDKEKGYILDFEIMEE